MGNSQIINFNQNISDFTDIDFINQLCFIQTRTLPYAGIVEIYRFKQPPYDYIMKHKRVFCSDDPTLQLYKQNLSIVANQLRHKNIAQIHYYRANSQFHMCGKTSQVQTYCNYYSISLDQMIKKRRQDDIRFTSNQIWYVLKSLLEVSVLLRKSNYNSTTYRSKNITLSSQGYLKLYIFHFNKDSFTLNDQTHNQQYTLALNHRINIYDYLPLPPQFLISLKNGSQTFTFNFQKQDSFMIATVAMAMMIDQDVRQYYTLNTQNFCTFKPSTLLKDLKLLTQVYDKKYLVSLLQQMLQQDPLQRISVTDALQFINNNRDNINIGGSLRMFQDDQNQIKPKISYRTSFDFQSSILKSIQPNILQLRLTACPIKPLSKRTHTRSIGVSLTSSKQSIQTKDKSLTKSRVIKQMQSRGQSLANKLKLIKS